MWATLVNGVLSIASMVPFLSHLAPPTVHNYAGKCLNPVERREWRALSVSERAAWISGIQCLAKMPHNPAIIETQFDPSQPRLNLNSSFYDDLTFVHNDLSLIIHGTGYFFPWHRNFLHTLEARMRTHCGYNGVMPYWDWSQDSRDFENSPFWDSDPKSGLGGFGNPDAHMRVQDGAFSDFTVAYPYPHVLHRRFSLRPWLNSTIGFHIIPDKMVNETFTPDEVSRVISSHVGDYRGFQKDVAALPGMHSSVHRMVGGDLAGLCPPDAPKNGCKAYTLGISPNDPLFYLLHSMLDKMWYQWQNAHPMNKNAFSGGSIEHMADTEDFDKFPVGGPPDLNLTSVLPSDGLFGRVTVGDVLSTTGGFLCYEYK